MLAPFVIFSLLTTTCGQQCVNCVPQQRQYQYVVNVPMVPVQGVAVPSNNPQPCCNPNPAGQTATQVFWYSQGNGQQNSGMVSNFTSTNAQGGLNYQNVGGPNPQYVTNGNYIAPGTSPQPNQETFTSPPPNYNPDVYLQSTTSSPSFTGQTLSPSGMPFVPPGNQPYNQNSGFNQQQGGQGTYNSANQGFMQNQGPYQTQSVSSQGGPNPLPNGEGNFYGQDEGFQGSQNYQGEGQMGYYQGGTTGQQGIPSGQQNLQGGQGQLGNNGMPPGQYSPQASQGPVGNNGMTVNTVTSYQQSSSGGTGIAGGAAGAALGAAGAAGAAIGAATGYPYSTSSQYPTTTRMPPQSNTPGSTATGGFQYSTQNPNQQNFSPSQTGFSNAPFSSTMGPGGSPSTPYSNTQQGQFSSTAYPNQAQIGGGFQGSSSQMPNQQGGMYSTNGGSSFGQSTSTPFSQQNEGQFSTQYQYNQGNAGYMPTTSGSNQFSPSSTMAPFGQSSNSPYATTTPYSSNTQYMGGQSTSPYNTPFGGPQGSSQGPNYNPSSTMGPTGYYPTGAQQDQSPTTRPSNVNVAGVSGGQATTPYNPSSSSSSGSSMLGQDSRGGAQGQFTSTPGSPMGVGAQGQYTSMPGSPIGGGASGGPGYTPQYDIEHNMNTQYGHYNSTSSTGPSRDAPQTTSPTSSTGGLPLVVLLAITLLFF